MTADQIRHVLASWLGPAVAVHAEPVSRFPLAPEEHACVQKAVPQRLAEFSTGRYCAHRALASLGGPPDPILIGERHAPLWPAGFTGAITHAAGWGAAVAVRRSACAGIGIDIVDLAEAARVLQDSGSSIASARELAIRAPGVDAAVLVFSAKESAIKAVSEIAGRYVDFPEIALTVSGNRFEARCPEPVEGWWLAEDGLLLTAAIRK